MTLDHVGFAVADFAKSQDFYTQALAPLGIAIVMGGDGYAGMGRDGRAQFWFNAGTTIFGRNAHRLRRRRPRAGSRVPRSGARGGRQGQRRPRPATAISPELLRRLRHRPERPQRRGRLPQAGRLNRYSAATAGRACSRRSARSIHCAVSFSCAPFCASRSCSAGKSTRSSAWSWLKQENTTSARRSPDRSAAAGTARRPPSSCTASAS